MAKVGGGNKLKKRLASAPTSAMKVRVGFLEKARYPDGKLVAMIAAIQDFGAPRAGIPPRPFFRNMIAKHKGEWGPALGRLLREGKTPEEALNILGLGIAGQLRQSIVDTNTPPLAPVTIRRKGFSKPLVDTGHMLNSIDHEVTS